MPAKIERVALHEMQNGQLGDFFALLCERSRKSTRDGKPFYHLRFRDRIRSAGVPIWENSSLFEPCDRLWQPGQFFKLRATYIEGGKYGPQLDVQAIRLVNPSDHLDGFDPSQFVASTRFDIDGMYNELLTYANAITDVPLRRLVVSLLEEHADDIKRFPAASHNHHNYRGGYLEHTVSMTRTGLYLADKYREYYPDLEPPLNKDLIVAGCILHDIGKVHELECDSVQPTYTIVGNLIGHVLIGRDMVRDAAKHTPGLDCELLLLLEHIITAHQGLAEWGAPKPPMIPEALLVHFADDIDAKMNMFISILNGHEGENPFTDGNNLLRRKLLKQRKL